MPRLEHVFVIYFHSLLPRLRFYSVSYNSLNIGKNTMSLLAKIVETIILIKLYLIDDTIEKIRKRGEKK